jgi:hypothetical protein
MEIAKRIHETRLETLYVDPQNLGNLAHVGTDQLQALLNLAELRAREQAKKLRDLTDEQKSGSTGFVRCGNPTLRPMVLQGSLEKQAEFKEDPIEWIHWLKKTIEEWQRSSQELTMMEMNRVPPSGEQGFEDKWQIKIRLRSWSHSIRPKPLNVWNEKIEKIKLFPTKDKSELLVTFIAPKKLKLQMVWEGGM